MDFANESYVRVYTRDTTLWRRMEFEGQTVFLHLERRLDRSGVLGLDGLSPQDAVALNTSMPQDLIRVGLAKLLELGVLVLGDDALVDPAFVEAQEASKSNKQRQREFKERRRSEKLQTLPEQPSQCLSNETLPKVTLVTLPVTEVTHGEAEQSEATQCDGSGSDLSSQISDARTGAVVELRSGRALAYEWLNAATGCAPNLMDWAMLYERLWLKPADERALVAKHLMQTSYIRKERRKAKPDHVLKYWDDFVAGPRNSSDAAYRKNSGPSQVSPLADHQAEAQQFAAANGGSW